MRLLPLGFWLIPAAAMAAAPDGKAIFLHGNDNGAMPCAACHGLQAQGNPNTGAPRLAGLPAAGITADLRRFAQGTGNPIMQSIAVALTPGERQAVAEYLSGLPTPTQ